MIHGFKKADYEADVAAAVAAHGPLGGECWEIACSLPHSDGQLAVFLNGMREVAVGHPPDQSRVSYNKTRWSNEKINLVGSFVLVARARRAAAEASRTVEREKIRAAQAAVAEHAAKQNAELQAKFAALEA